VNDERTATYTYRDVDAEVEVIAIVDGPDAGTSHEVHDGLLRVGTSKAADVQLTDRGVSRLHCSFTIENGHIRLRDLGSKNGTWVSGVRVYDAEVSTGARIKIGATTLELSSTSRRVKRAVWHGGDRFGRLHGSGPAMHRLFALLAKIAEAPGPALIRGESGTGKELVARALHDQSPRADGPFVIVDGGAICQTLATAELFGYEKGAFTGATMARAGAFERADGGTLFIDEVGDLPPETQPMLLRALAEGEVKRVGGSESRRVNVRVVAATHQPLEELVNAGAFREDLLHRLRVFEVRLPPLRHRPEDVAMLARRFLAELGDVDQQATERLERALAERAGYLWPGNVRELRAFVHRTHLLGEEAATQLGPPPSGLPSVEVDLPMKEAKRHWVDAFERIYLARLLSETSNRVGEAAERAEMDRGYLGRLAIKHGLR
jgi:DNA-binding NtrC family response regulator